MTVSLVQSRGSRRAAGKVRHATSERTSEAGPRAGLFETADRAVDPHAEDDGGRLPDACRGRRASLRRCCRDERGGGRGAAVSAGRIARTAADAGLGVGLGRAWQTRRDPVLVWEEYRQHHRDGYSYSQFRRHFLDHTSASAEPRMRREHAPGAASEVDYAGMTLTISTAEGQVSVFVACLPFSGYLYAEATWTQTAEDWLASHVRMFSYL